MADTAIQPPPAKSRVGAFDPLQDGVFRSIWCSSLLSNFGQLILGVGAAWQMTKIAPHMTALVQSALMLPLMLVAVPAGAIADMFDRRKVAMLGLGFASCCSMLLTTLATLNLVTPWTLLAFCSLIGAGVALYSPAWQASVREQVRPDHLAAAVSLASISYNIARSFGPALGGVIVAIAGTRAAFAINATCYLPLLGAFFLWKRRPVPSRLPPERLDRAIVSGARYMLHAPPIRAVVLRALIYGMISASNVALMPLLAHNVLHGNAETYGMLLGTYGVGAVAGALLLTDRLRTGMTPENAVRLCLSVSGSMIACVGLTTNLYLVGAALAVAGAVSMPLLTLLNVGVQFSAPRWVTARALAWYSSALTGGITIGATVWGQIANNVGVQHALLAGGITMILSIAFGLILPMPGSAAREIEPAEMAGEPEVALALTLRSGPLVIELDYHVDPAQARQFYDAMLKLGLSRKRNGAFDWSLARDIADPSLWTERYHYPTWGDYLRQRTRTTQADRDLQERVNAYHMADGKTRVRRRLERPYGSVRWRAETPDPDGDTIGIYTP